MTSGTPLANSKCLGQSHVLMIPKPVRRSCSDKPMHSERLLNWCFVKEAVVQAEANDSMQAMQVSHHAHSGLGMPATANATSQSSSSGLRALWEPRRHGI